MKALSPAHRLILVALLPLTFASCGTMKVVTAAKEKTVSGVSNLAKVSMNTIRPQRVAVVEVREKDLKELPTGEERALAYQGAQRQKKRGFLGLFNGPMDFKEPVLPVPGGENFEGVLPPIE